MKKKNVKENNLSLYFITITLAILVIGTLFVILTIKAKKSNNEIFDAKKDIKFVGIYQDKKIHKQAYLINTYEEYKKIFNKNNLTEENFENNKYLLIQLTYDECSEKDIKPYKYNINKNNINITFEYESKCGLCGSQYMYYILELDKSIIYSNVSIDYKVTSKEKCDSTISYKPLIYLYPEQDTKVNVKLSNPNLLTTSYPKYEDGWTVLAKPNGDLTDSNGKKYYGLYWEANNNFDNTYNDGFVVEKENIISFLEEKLKLLGLNEKESNEFILYWLPKLEENKYNLIRFEETNIINEQMNLLITPTPDTIIRVLMKYKPIDKKIEIKEQKIITPERKGFTVVEWGGTLVK